MINLTQDTNDSFSEYKAAVDRKNDDSIEKNELLSIEKPMEDCYINYKQHFDSNNLENLNAARVGQQHKDTLLGLYSSNAAIVKNFRMRYFAQNPQTYNNLCPYCTLSEANTTEHILPKEKYPEYAVDTLNLIPACSGCNSKKGDSVIDAISGKRTTINYYTDILPQEQYLYMDFDVSCNNIKATYRLENYANKIDGEMYSLIERHFAKFDLLNRFNIKAIQEIGELINLYVVEGISNEAEYNTFAAKQIRKINLDKPQLGYNHWKVILYQSAATSDVFKNYILSLYGKNLQ